MPTMEEMMTQSLFNKPYAGADVGYVLVIVRDTNGKFVLVVKKTRPSWQAGRYNFPGGKIEAGETPVQAAARELEEETSIRIAEHALRPVSRIVSNGYFEMYVFATETDAIFTAMTMTDEQVEHVTVADLLQMGPERALESLAQMYREAFN